MLFLVFLSIMINVEMRREESLFFMALVEQVVNSGHLVMLIVVETLLGVVCFEPELL